MGWVRGDGPRGWSGGDGWDVLWNEHILFFQIPVVEGLWGFSLGFSSQIDNSELAAGWTILGSWRMEITQPQERIGCGAGQDRPSSLFPNWTQSSANYVASGWEGLWVLGCEVCWFSVLPSAAIPPRPWLPGTSTPHSFVFNKSSVQRGMWTRAVSPCSFPVHLQPLRVSLKCSSSSIPSSSFFSSVLQMSLNMGCPLHSLYCKTQKQRHEACHSQWGESPREANRFPLKGWMALLGQTPLYLK